MKGKLRKVIKEVPPGGIKRDVAGGCIEDIWPDEERGFVCVQLTDGRVLAIMGTGVLVFMSRDIYEEHAAAILKDVEEDAKKQIQ